MAEAGRNHDGLAADYPIVDCDELETSVNPIPALECSPFEPNRTSYSRVTLKSGSSGGPGPRRKDTVVKHCEQVGVGGGEGRMMALRGVEMQERRQTGISGAGKTTRSRSR